MTKEFSFPKNKIKFLLLEEVHPVAVDKLQRAGYAVKTVAKSLSSDELLTEIADAHVLGIRSKTKVEAKHLEAAKKLLAIGCFGVGTNQVDLDSATNHGVPVFNAPFGNTRSVAELAMAMIFGLARKMPEKSCKMHHGRWDKSAKGAIEVRGKTLGLIGFGYIGQQVGLLAQSVGMNVIFFDTIRKLELGNARQVDSIADLLKAADFVSLHVPALPKGQILINKNELDLMKPGSYLLNLSRGTLVDLPALRAALQSGRLAGAGIDVYPKEPQTNSEPFECELAGLDNVILTPHLGGSTEEAQYNIGLEVSAAFIKYIDTGGAGTAVNFPKVELAEFQGSHRILNIHRNVPGVLTEINGIISQVGANIDSQILGTYKDIGYLIMDVSKAFSDDVKDRIAALSSSIKTRILY